MKFRDVTFWSSLLTVLVTLGVLGLTDAELMELSETIVQFIKYSGLTVAGLLTALGIRSDKGEADE